MAKFKALTGLAVKGLTSVRLRAGPGHLAVNYVRYLSYVLPIKTRLNDGAEFIALR